MIFKETAINGAYIVKPEKLEDERGYFARSFCKKEFAGHNISFNPVQENIGYSKCKYTLRGLHYQVHPYEEEKLVRCVQGSLFDVIVDVRPDSSSYKQWFGIELSADNNRMLYIPKGCAHGYQTLADQTKVAYLVSQFYTPTAEKGIRWDDPAIGIEWKETDNVILSEKDQNWANFK